MKVSRPRSHCKAGLHLGPRALSAASQEGPRGGAIALLLGGRFRSCGRCRTQTRAAAAQETEEGEADATLLVRDVQGSVLGVALPAPRCGEVRSPCFLASTPR